MLEQYMLRSSCQLSKVWSSRVAIVPIMSALSAFREDVGIEAPNEKIIKLDMENKRKACCTVSSYNPHTKQIETGLSCAGCQLAREANMDQRYITGLDAELNTVYSRNGFLDHFVWCQQAQKLWRESKDGTVKPRSFPRVCEEGSVWHKPALFMRLSL
jgi:hypothetical protein